MARANDQAREPARDYRRGFQIFISCAAIMFILLHLICPALRVDNVVVALLVIALVPWLGSIFKRVKIPGFLEVEYEVRRLTARSRLSRERSRASITYPKQTPRIFARRYLEAGECPRLSELCLNWRAIM